MLSTRSEEYIEGPRHAVVTSDDNGAVLQIVSYFLIVVAILATLLRLFLRVNIAQAAGFDDGLACLAMVCDLPLRMNSCVDSVVDTPSQLFAVGEVIATSSGVEKGLGTKVDLLSDGRILDVKKARTTCESLVGASPLTGPNSQDVYVALILYILAIAASKGSALFFIQRLVASKLHRLALRALGVILAVWTVASVLTTSLRCGLPHPWERPEGECLAMVRVSPGHLDYTQL
jgi:hypothetical protein